VALYLTFVAENPLSFERSRKLRLRWLAVWLPACRRPVNELTSQSPDQSTLSLSINQSMSQPAC